MNIFKNVLQSLISMFLKRVCDFVLVYLVLCYYIYHNSINQLQQFHTGMCAEVVMAGSQSSSFPVEVGVKQVCVIAPIIFNLLLATITLVFHRDLQSSVCVGIEHRLNGGLFNLRRLQAKTNTSSMISALQYADDAAFLSLTADGLQRSLDVMSENYLRAGLVINTTKTEKLSTSSPDAPTFQFVGISLRPVKTLPTWAQISHFLMTSQMRSKDALTLLHQPLAV